MRAEDFAGAVRLTAERYRMDFSRPLALVSGGPDSVALLRVLLELCGEPAVLHVDHDLRGEESREDAGFVRELCECLGVRCVVRRVELEEGPNLQERARVVRYRLAEVLDYLSGLSQPYRTDLTNLTGKYARNRVRLEVLPILEELHPGAARNLARAAALAREDLEALEELAAEAVERRGGEVVLPAKGLSGLPPALRRHAVRRAYATMLPHAPPLKSALVEAVLGLGTEGTKTLDLPGGVVVAARGDEIALYPAEEPTEEQKELRVGETLFAGWNVSAREVSRFDPRDASRAEIVYLDASKGPYEVRLAGEGDIIRPLGLGGTKKVLRAMMDRKVPRDRRRRTPVVVDARGEVAWIFFGELGEGFKVDEATESMVRLEVARIS